MLMQGKKYMRTDSEQSELLESAQVIVSLNVWAFLEMIREKTVVWKKELTYGS